MNWKKFQQGSSEVAITTLAYQMTQSPAIGNTGEHSSTA
jgi:hypothetical protein